MNNNNTTQETSNGTKLSGDNTKKSELPQNNVGITGNVNSHPPVEEFVYQKRSNINMSKLLKRMSLIAPFILIIVLLAVVFLKFNPFGKPKVTRSGEITWWVLGMDEGVLNSMKDEYISKNPNVKINIVTQSETDYAERLLNKLKENSGPDVFTIHNSWVPMFMEHLDAMPQNVYTKEEFSKTYYPVIVKDLMTSNGIVGMPLEYDALTLYLNDDIFSYSGKTAPRTWDQFSPLAADLTTTGTKGLILQSGAAMGWVSNVDYWPEIIALLMIQNKSSMYSPITDAAHAFEAMRTFGSFRSTLKTWDDTLPRSTIAFANGKVAMMFAPAKAASEIKKENPNLKFRTVTLPQIRRDDPNEPEYSYSTYWIQAVSNKSSDKPLAWDFLKYLSTEESLTKMYEFSEKNGVEPKIYPRIEMRDKLINHRIFGSVVALAPVSTSWYLYNRTNDGSDGINTLVREAYKSVVDSISLSKGTAEPTKKFKDLSLEIKKALQKYKVNK